VALIESLIAAVLILGVFTNLACVSGMLMALVIWTTAESFGGPYTTGATDIGAAVMYAVVLAGLFLSPAGLQLGFDRQLTPRLGGFGFLASGTFRRGRSTGRAAASPEYAA
jgi:nitrite reductase (NO-forming)